MSKKVKTIWVSRDNDKKLERCLVHKCKPRYLNDWWSSNERMEPIAIHEIIMYFGISLKPGACRKLEITDTGEGEQR